MFMKEGNIYVTPEKWAAKITELGKAMEKAVNIISENNGSSLNYIQTSIKNIKNDTQKITEETSKYTKSYSVFQNKISELEEEIKRYKSGYDNKILKQFISKFIRINLSIKKLLNNSNDDDIKRLSNIHIMLEQAIEEVGVSIIKPKIGDDYTESNNQVADNPKQIETDNKDSINKIADVLEQGYELIGTDKNEVIIPAKVSVYVLKERG